MTGRTLPVALSLLILVSFLCYWQETFLPIPIPAFLGKQSATRMSLSSLGMRISQTSSSPPTIRVTLDNNSSSTTFTILTWDTPFDPKAVALGVFQVKDAGTGEEVPSPNLKINRKLPPSREALFELPPGKDFSVDVKFEEPLIKLEKGKKYQIRAVGRWKGVWPAATPDVKEDDLTALGGGSECLTGEFESEEIAFSPT